MIVPQPPPYLPPFDPEAVITRRGRWVYSIEIVDGVIGMSAPWHAFSRRHAESRARKKLAWYVRKFGPPQEHWTIRDG
jgi:hypothetical protein